MTLKYLSFEKIILNKFLQTACTITEYETLVSQHKAYLLLTYNSTIKADLWWKAIWHDTCTFFHSGLENSIKIVFIGGRYVNSRDLIVIACKGFTEYNVVIIDI